MHVKAKYIIPAFVALLLGPLFYFHMPLHLTSPDIQFAQAKVLRVLHGELFSDPVTGYPSFHPPYYYLILAIFARLGLSINLLFFIVTVSNVALLVLFTYLILKRQFGPDIALLSNADREAEHNCCVFSKNFSTPPDGKGIYSSKNLSRNVYIARRIGII